MSTQSLGGYDHTQDLVQNAEFLGPDIYRRQIQADVWSRLVKQGNWPDGVGDEATILTYERTLPASVNTWSGINTGSDKFLLPDKTTIPTAKTRRTFGLEHTAIESDPLNVIDTRQSFKFQEQLRNVYENLVENVAYAWKQRWRSQYTEIGDHKIVAYLAPNQQLLEDSSDMPVQSGGSDLDADKVSRLTEGILKRCYRQLLMEGGYKGASGMENGKPIFTLVTSMETSDVLMRESAGNNTVNAFINNNTRVGELLAPLGVERSFNGFYHVVDMHPRRWDYDGGAWVEVPAYIEDTSSYSGKEGSTNRWIMNPAFENAEYEDSYILLTNVMESVVMGPFTGTGKVKFDPVQYRGDFKFLNIEDLSTNPDKTWGLFRAVLGNGAKPISPQYGYTIRHKRVEAGFAMIDADGSSISYPTGSSSASA